MHKPQLAGGPGRCGALVVVAPWSRWRRGRCGALVVVGPWSRWRRGRGGGAAGSRSCRGGRCRSAPACVRRACGSPTGAARGASCIANGWLIGKSGFLVLRSSWRCETWEIRGSTMPRLRPGWWWRSSPRRRRRQGLWGQAGYGHCGGMDFCIGVSSAGENLYPGTHEDGSAASRSREKSHSQYRFCPRSGSSIPSVGCRSAPAPAARPGKPTGQAFVEEHIRT